MPGNIFNPGPIANLNGGNAIALQGRAINATAPTKAQVLAWDTVTSQWVPYSIPQRYVNVLDYGATGNGTTDDSTSINNAINAAQTASLDVFFPVGTYKCNITVPSFKSVRLFGPANAYEYTQGATLVPASNSSPVVYIPFSEGVTLQNLTIIGNGAFNSGSSGVYAWNNVNSPSGRQVYLIEVNIKEFETGLLSASYLAQAVLCTFQNCKYNVRLLGGSDHFQFVSCLMGFPMQTSAGVYQASGSRTNFGVHCTDCRGIVLTACDMGQCGIAIYSSGSIISVTAHIEGTDICGIQCDGSGSIAVVASTVQFATIPFDVISTTSGMNVMSPIFFGDPPEDSFRARDTQICSCLPPTVVNRVNGSNVHVAYQLTNGTQLRVGIVASDLSYSTSPGDYIIVQDARIAGDSVETSSSLSNYNTSTGKWKCPNSGQYRFYGRLITSGGAGAGFLDIRAAITATTRISTFSAIPTEIDFDVVISCQAGDTFWLLFAAFANTTFLKDVSYMNIESYL